MQVKTETSKTNARLLIAGVAAVAFTALALAGCNTVEGAGEDLKESSQNVKEALSGDD